MAMDHLPVIDWAIATRLAGNKRELANELLSYLVNTLPQDVNAIEQLHKDGNYQELLKRVHKLHGAVCYTGTPRLKEILSLLESQLKSNIMDSLPSLLDQFYIEVNLLREQHPA